MYKGEIYLREKGKTEFHKIVDDLPFCCNTLTFGENGKLYVHTLGGGTVEIQKVWK